MRAWRSLQEDEHFNIDTHPGMIDAGTTDAANDSLDPAIQKLSAEATKVTVAAIRKAFDVPAFDDGGLTEAECLQLFVQFCLYMDSLKKSTARPVTSPPRTESATTEGLTTKPSLACGS